MIHRGCAHCDALLMQCVLTCRAEPYTLGSAPIGVCPHNTRLIPQELKGVSRRHGVVHHHHHHHHHHPHHHLPSPALSYHPLWRCHWTTLSIQHTPQHHTLPPFSEPVPKCFVVSTAERYGWWWRQQQQQQQQQEGRGRGGGGAHALASHTRRIQLLTPVSHRSMQSTLPVTGTSRWLGMPMG